jgi:hypothetical protein
MHLTDINNGQGGTVQFTYDSPLSSSSTIAYVAGMASDENGNDANILRALNNAGFSKSFATQIGAVNNAVENIEKMRKAYEQIQKDGPSAFLSSQFEGRLKEQLKDKGPIAKMLINGQTPTPESSLPVLIKNSPNSLLPMLLKNDPRNAFKDQTPDE